MDWNEPWIRKSFAVLWVGICFYGVYAILRMILASLFYPLMTLFIVIGCVYSLHQLRTSRMRERIGFELRMISTYIMNGFQFPTM